MQTEAHRIDVERGPAARRGALTIGRLTLIVLALGLLARLVRYALNFPLWGDEAFLAVNFHLRDFAGMFDPLAYGQIAPPGYLWATLALSKLFGTAEWALRLTAVAGGVLGLLVFARFVSRRFSAPIALTAVAFLAASYYPIRHGAEVKPYATDLLIGLLLTCAGQAVFERPRSAARWSLLIVLGGLSVWCSYTAVFVAGGVGLFLTWMIIVGRVRTPGVVAGWALYGIVVCGSFAAMYHYFAGPHAAAVPELSQIDMWRRTFPPANPLKLLLWLVTTHTGNMLAYPFGGRNGGSTATTILAVIGCVYLWRSRREWLVLLLAPLVLNFIAAVFHKYPYGGTARISLYMAPAFCLLAGIGLFVLLRRLVAKPKRMRSVRIAAGVLAAITIGGIVSDVAKPYKKRLDRDRRRIIAELAQAVSPNDRVLVFNADREVSYAPYLFGWKGDGAQFVFYLHHDLPVAPIFAPPPDEAAPNGDGKTWLLVYHGYKYREYFSGRQLEAYLGALSKRLGPARRESFVVQRQSGVDVQIIDRYEFADG
ncbi:MAG: glycosyltransferase family 39 protein [Phycisphaerae bacterium]